ncbi:MAG: eukaryotic-like serine/threonine-protein kinase [Solirubrobacteraceae bacterium]|nr:eukaryotic-like serine/threonine-protein kinase [Solirubrobacteraceae bacterium]
MARTLERIQLPSRYRVLRHIATGGMASVYAAVDEILGRDVAIKVLDESLGAEAGARRRFTREARAAARVSDHPHVVTIYDIAETDADPPVAFIVMELLSGGTLADRLKAGEPIPHSLALRWLEQTASALDAAHAAGMVHRDVKPANLLLDGHGTLKVGDFGIATIASEAPLTQTGQVVGTAAYFSPEQALGKPATAASDRYALAVVAFELLTGRRPFPQGTPAAQALAHADSDPPPASMAAPELPVAVDGVLAQGLAKAPEDRPGSAAELVARLRGALGATAATGVAHPVGERTTRVAPVPVQRRMPRTPAPASAAAEVRPPVRSRRSNRAGLIAAVAALVLAGVAIAAIAGGGDSHPAATTAARQKAVSTTATQPTTSTPTAPATTSAPPPPAAGGAPPDAAGIEQQAHAAVAAGDYQGAIAQLGGLVNRCDVAITDPCAYAWFDLGDALLRAGNPQAAIPVLEHRLQNPNQSGVVQSELDQARAQASGGGGAPAPAPHGKGHDHQKKPGKGG